MTKMGRSTTSSWLWATTEAFAGQGIGLLVTLILVRLLEPADFGVFAIVAFFTSFAAATVNGGISSAVIQRAELDHDIESTLFWIALFCSLIVGIAFTVVAPWLATAYTFPELRPLMFVGAVQVVLSSIAVVPGALLARNLEFGKLAKVALLSSSVSGALSIFCAVSGIGVMALGVQMVSSSAISTAGLWVCCKWRPKLSAKINKARETLGYAFWINLSGMLETAYSQGASLLIGKLYGARDLGLLDRTRNINAIPGNFFIGIITRISLPLFTGLDNDKVAQREYFRSFSTSTMLVSVPITMACIAAPDLIILVLLGENWIDAAPILAVLAFSAIFMPIHAINLQLILAHGEAGLYFQIEMAKKIAGILCVAVGSWFGIIGLAWGYVVASLIALALNAWPSQRLIEYSLQKQLTEVFGILICGSAMGLTVYAVHTSLSLQPVAELFVSILAGGAVYVALGCIFRLSAFWKAADLTRRSYRRFSRQP